MQQLFRMAVVEVIRVVAAEEIQAAAVEEIQVAVVAHANDDRSALLGCTSCKET